MAKSAKGSSIGRSASSGRYVTVAPKSGKSSSSSVAALRAGRTAEIASALKQANRKTGLFTDKK